MTHFLALNDGWLEIRAEVHGCSLKELVVSVDGERHLKSPRIFPIIPPTLSPHEYIHRNR